MANRSEFLKPRRGSNSSDEGLLPFSEEPVDAGHSNSCTSEAQCSECDFHDPAAVVKCEGCDKWFCNVYGKSGNDSHIVKHLAGSGHFQVALHPRNLLGSSFAIECSVCHSKNVFNLLCSNNLTLACTLHTLGDANWQPLIKDSYFLGRVVSALPLLSKCQTDLLAGDKSMQLPSASSNSSKESGAALSRLLLAAATSLFFMVGELIGGLLSNSLAILADSAHMLTDLLGLLISIFAICMSRRQITNDASFGYHRIEVLGAVASITLVWIVEGTLAMNAIDRLTKPQDVVGLIMLVTASCGIGANLLMIIVLHSYLHPHHNLHLGHAHREPKENALIMKSAVIHVLGDFLQSLGVLVAAVVVYCNPDWKVADPISTIIFSLLTVCLTIPIVLECIHILLEKTPRNINIKNLCDSLRSAPGVMEMHNLHVWSLSPGKTSLSCHLKSNAPFDSLKEATRICKQLYDIAFVTIQVEEFGDEKKDIGCSITRQ